MQILSDHGLEASGNDLRGGLVPKLPKACGAVTVEGRLKFQKYVSKSIDTLFNMFIKKAFAAHGR